MALSKWPATLRKEMSGASMAVLAVTSELDVFLALVVMGLRTDAFLLSRAKSRCGARSSALRGELLQSSPRRASAISLKQACLTAGIAARALDGWSTWQTEKLVLSLTLVRDRYFSASKVLNKPFVPRDVWTIHARSCAGSHTSQVRRCFPRRACEECAFGWNLPF